MVIAYLVPAPSHRTQMAKGKRDIFCLADEIKLVPRGHLQIASARLVQIEVATDR